jgi:hypothetical protein
LQVRELAGQTVDTVRECRRCRCAGRLHQHSGQSRQQREEPSIVPHPVTQLSEIARALQSAQWGWLLAAMLASAFTYPMAAVQLIAAAAAALPLGRTSPHSAPASGRGRLTAAVSQLVRRLLGAVQGPRQAMLLMANSLGITAGYVLAPWFSLRRRRRDGEPHARRARRC